MNAGELTTAPPGSTVREALALAVPGLSSAGVDTAQLDAELLLAHACGWTRTQLFAAAGDVMAPGVANRFAELLVRRNNREPLAYIVGRQEFWSLDFAVGPAVLIPRPETERLVEVALDILRSRARPRVADVGTGSGCIAIALAHERPDLTVWASEISADARVLARSNAARLGVDQRIQFVSGDLLAPLAGAAPFDLICSNPPYVPLADAPTLQPELRCEPTTALFGGADGLGVIRRLLAESPALLARDGLLLMEVGFGQATAVRELAKAAGFAGIEIIDDYAGVPRVLQARMS